MENVSAELKEFIIEYCKKYFNTNFHISQLRNDTSIEDDIGITGDDVEIFMNNFSSKFNVDISAFDAKKYFGAESEDTDMFWPIVRVLFGNRAWMPLAKKDRSKLTLAMLEKAKNDRVLL